MVGGNLAADKTVGVMHDHARPETPAVRTLNHLRTPLVPPALVTPALVKGDLP
ncbi:hypothetical protein J3R73_002869 [Labrys monachus]|uniref:Uncharacterized protein n=1 Tax=Labrys monachus TaxID=217067 RepID=A0ABU0FFH1_9HYPH|nr:hypothetical protein [Labrys monachus]